jgi:hypothetical protein
MRRLHPILANEEIGCSRPGRIHFDNSGRNVTTSLAKSFWKWQTNQNIRYLNHATFRDSWDSIPANWSYHQGNNCYHRSMFGEAKHHRNMTSWIAASHLLWPMRRGSKGWRTLSSIKTIMSINKNCIYAFFNNDVSTRSSSNATGTRSTVWVRDAPTYCTGRPHSKKWGT